MDIKTTLQPLSMDINEVPLTENGIPGFVWPLSWDEHGEIRDQLLSDVASIIQAAFTTEPDEAELLAIGSSSYISEALSCLFVCIVQQRYREVGYDVRFDRCEFDNGGNIIAWLKRPQVKERLAQQVKKKLLKDVVRSMAGLVRPGAVRYRTPMKSELVDTAIVVNASRLADYHAQTEPLKPICVNQRYWFAGADRHMSDCRETKPVRADLRASLVQAVKNSVAPHGINVPDVILDYLDGYIAESTGFVRGLLNYVKSRPERLPKRLWTGTSGNVAHRILHSAVRDNGGKSWSHDHGSGTGYFDEKTMSLFEFSSPDVMVTFSESQVACYQANKNKHLMLGEKFPEIVTINRLPIEHSKKAPTNRPTIKSSKRNVLYISTQYRAEIGRLITIDADVVLVDWQTRLFSWLKKNGDVPIFKAHPDSIASPARRFAELLNVETITTPFEQLDESYDIIILDYSNTALLYNLLAGQKPIIFFDFNNCPFQPQAHELFERRVRVVKGWYDADNRRHIDWSDLVAALNDAYERIGDTQFIETYVPFGRG